MKWLEFFFGKKPTTGGVPTAAVLYRFRALTDFWSPELASQYVKGSVYSVRRGNTALDALVMLWRSQGKVEVL